MASLTLLGQQANYWLAGGLTVIAATLVTVVIVMSSGSDSGKTP